MDFGKLLSVDQVDFKLGPEPSGNVDLLASLSVADTSAIYLGPTGYNTKPWVGSWYPPGAREQDFLKHYGVQFNTIEFNTTHYRMPDPSIIRKWCSMVPADFRFCPKVPQSISHSRDLGLTGSEPQIFCNALLEFGELLGCSFMQLPPHFGLRELPILARFLDKYAPQIPLAVEVRHPAFFQETTESNAFFDLLTQYNTTAVITDVAGRRDVCHMHLTSPRTMIRFVGNGLHPSDYSRIEEWALRLKTWLENGLQEVYFFTHEPDNLLAPELTAFCAETFANKLANISIRGPKPVAGQQGTLF
jgi:uncharacterized protein YecE (DUF72 family)